MTVPHRRHYDVLIVGARPAGAATAMLLARAGLDVLAVDRAAAGADTLSTHALMRGGVMQLARWGLLDEVLATGAPLLTETRFHYGSEVVAIPFTPDRFSGGLVAPRRTVLDPLLARAAGRAGAEVVHGARMTRLRWHADRVVGAEIVIDGRGRDVTADLVIGADGLTSPVARVVRAHTYRRGATAGASSTYRYVQGLDRHVNHWYFAPGASAGVIPTNDGAACVFSSVAAERFASEHRSDVEAGWRAALHVAAPELAADVDRARPRGPVRSFPGRAGHFRRSVGAGWALVGDAGHYNDPATAHGITAALRDAELLSRCIAGGEIDRYEERRDELASDIFAVTDRIASFAWDLDELRDLHIALSRSMRRETDAIAAWADAEEVAVA